MNGVSYSYDQSGNLITEGDTEYSYTYNNYLNTSHNLSTTTYTYDHQGQRIQKTGGNITTIYPSTLYEVTATNTEKHIYGNGILLATIKSDTPTPKLYHNHLDHLDSTKAVTTPDGYLNQELEYYPFGQTKVDNQYGNLTQSNQYIGQNFDQETELSYLNARYYDGVRGQMLSQDPVFLGVGVDERSTLILKDPQLQNSYGYGRNNPLIYKDPNGELAFLAPAIIGGVLGAIGGVATEAISGRDSSFSDYASAAGQGFVVGLGTGGVGTVATAYKLSGLVKTGAISGTAGTLSRLPKVKGRTPNLGTEAFFTGKHTQRQGAEEAVQVSVQSLGSAGRAYNSGGSSRSSSNKVSSNQYKSITLQLMKTKTALSKGDYDGATRALNSASNSLNNKRRK